MELKHLRDFFTHAERDAIVGAIHDAELQTSGEIRVRLDKRAGDDAKGAARRAFDALGMRKTELRNGVLFYLAVEDHKFVILADDGIYHKVPRDFWDKITENVISHFRTGQYAQGLVTGIHEAGVQLARYFPRQANDVNELPNDISMGDETMG